MTSVAVQRDPAYLSYRKPYRRIAVGHLMGRLTALEAGRLAKSDVQKIRSWHDGGGLYLVVDGRRSGPARPATASWAFRYMLHGKAHMQGLGSYRNVSLAEARRRAAEARQQLGRGEDPVAAKRAERAERRAALARELTFKDVAEDYLRANEAKWKNVKHAAQWKATLAFYAYPIIGGMTVGVVDADAVLKVLRQNVAPPNAPPRVLWEARPETASRVRGRIETVLDYAKVLGLRDGQNPAAWKGNLKLALPAKSAVAKVKHHAAMAFADLPGFVGQLQQEAGTSARALEFAILTAARTGEVIGATWSEIDLKRKIWIIASGRMKAGREHRVPLSERSCEIIREMTPAHVSPLDYIFPGARPGKPLSNMAFLMLLRRMKHVDLTVHGFRSTFRDWVSEMTDFPGELAEMALAHAIASHVEAAYRRGDMIEKRRQLMGAWESFCAGI